VRLLTEIYLVIAVGSISITVAGIWAVAVREHFNVLLAFVVLGIVAVVGFWLMAIDSSGTE
jgi:hypothetical protein